MPTKIELHLTVMPGTAGACFKIERLTLRQHGTKRTFSVLNITPCTKGFMSVFEALTKHAVTHSKRYGQENVNITYGKAVLLHV